MTIETICGIESALKIILIEVNTPEKKAALAAEGREVRQISSSQMSFDNRLDNFDKLVRQLSAISGYAPYEADLSIEGLRSFYNKLRAQNSIVINARAKVNLARTRREDLLYTPETGMVDLAKNIKSYFKSILGAKNLRYQQIAHIHFRNFIH